VNWQPPLPARRGGSGLRPALALGLALLGAGPATAQARPGPDVANPRAEGDGPADGDPSRDRAPAREEGDDGELLSPSDRRPVPDLDGRPPPAPTWGERLLWIPRTLLLPLHLVTEYVLRLPLVELVTLLEAKNVQERVINFFTFGPDDNGFLGPTFRFESGLSPAGGLFLRYRDAGVEGNTVNIFTLVGGADLFEVTARDQYTRPVAPDSPDRPWAVAVRAAYLRRPDGSFNGVGAAQDFSTARYSFDRVSGSVQGTIPFDVYELPGDYIDPTADEGLATPDVRYQHRGRFRALTGLQSITFGEDIRDGTTIPQAVEQGTIDELPAAYEEGYFAWFVGASIRWDSRRPRPLPGSGWELLGRSRLWVDVVDPEERTWVDAAAAVVGHWDVTNTRRVLSLALASEITHPLSGDVPFTETVSLAGTGPLSGFIEGRVRGRTGVAARAEYSWPVAFLADGLLHLAAGNGFDEGFSGFGFDRLRLSFGVGIATVDDVGDHGFQLSIAAGTDEIGDRPNVESIRLVFGGVRDF